MKKLILAWILVVSLCFSACDVLPEDIPTEEGGEDENNNGNNNGNHNGNNNGNNNGNSGDQGHTPIAIEYVLGSAEKLSYAPGEIFDCKGAAIKVTYSNGTTKTVNVTAEMVSTAPLTFGTTLVTVTFSEKGVTLLCYIPVTMIIDPYDQLKADAITQLSLHKDVIANATDGGVILLVKSYAEKIRGAENPAAITAFVLEFGTALADYLAEKARVIAGFEAADLTEKIDQLYSQFKSDILSAKTTAIDNAKAASTVREAEEYLAAFRIAVDNKLAEQKLYEDVPSDEGQIYEKIALLERLEEYEAEIADFKRIVDAANAEKEAETLAYYDDVLKDISREKKYITLALDLGSIDLEATIGSQLINEIDLAVADILEADRITINPLAYVEGTLSTTSEIQTLLDKVADKFAEASKKFGAEGVEELKARYGQPAGAPTFDDNFINLLLVKIQTRYDELNMIRAEAEDIIRLIDYAAALESTGLPGDAQDMAIQAAWHAIKAWNANYNVFTTEDSDGSRVLYLDYNKNFAGVIYTATGFNAETQKWTTIDETWDSYDVDHDYVITYFIPNLDELIEASKARFAAQAQLAIMNEKLDLDNIFYSTNAIVDSGDEIKEARAYHDAFLVAYSTTAYNQYFLVGGANPYKERLEAAEEKYADLMYRAHDANAAIEVYRDLIMDHVGNICFPDYAEGGLLKNAYDKYCVFAYANGALDHAGEAAYTDVITDEARLWAYMDHYTAEVAYIDAKDIKAVMTINFAWMTRDDAAKRDAVAPPTFRSDLELFKTEMVNYIQAHYSYDALPVDLVVEGVLLTADNAQFYYNAILAYNVAIVDGAAETVADYILNTIDYETDLATANPLPPIYP